MPFWRVLLLERVPTSPSIRLILFLAAFFMALNIHATITPPLMLDGHTVLVLSDGSPVTLCNNPAAVDPTLDELMAFLRDDNTNLLRYRDGKFVCVEFAVTLHDRAEFAGWRAGYVTIRFESGPGHAINVFRTTDHGLIYVDCTGTRDGHLAEFGDSFSYIQKGRPYGTLPIAVAKASPSSYAFFERIQAISRGMERWSAQLQRTGAALEEAKQQMENARPKINPRSQAQVAEFNRLIQVYNARGEAYNKEARELNAASRGLQVKPGVTASPVTDVRLFW